MKVSAIFCNVCNVYVFSRSHHDCRWCPSKHVLIDGGDDYCKVGYSDKLKPTIVTLEISQTAQELYDDWNLKQDKFGAIPYNQAKLVKK